MIKSNRLIDAARVEKIFGRSFSKVPITPNQWTALSLVLGAAGLAMIVLRNNFVYALAFFVAAFAADYIDGAVARFRRSETRLGAYLDGIADRFVEAMIITGLMFQGIPDLFADANILLTSLLFTATMTSYARAYADHKGIVTDKKKLVAMGGVLERFERVSILLLSMIASLFYGAQVISYAVVALLLLSFLTVLQRVAYSVNEAKK